MSTTHPAELNNGVWTSWLPVSTAWPPISACGSEAWARQGVNIQADSPPWIYDPGYAESVANSATCLPPAATTWWEGATTVTNTITSWSMGPMVCPEAYTTFSTSLVSGSSTSVICCPPFVYSKPLARNCS